MPRFAILEHDWPTPHWDFLLESGPVLRSWRLLSEPTVGVAVPVEKNAVHRLLYLDYEGPVSGDRGTVSRWDSGIFEWIIDGTESIEVVLYGARLSARCVIEGSRMRLE